MIGIFMYNYMDGNVPNAFQNFFHVDRNIHDYEFRNADDIQVPYGRLDIRRFSIIIAGANLWNSLPVYVKNANTVHLFKRYLNNYLLDIKGNVIKGSCVVLIFECYTVGCTCDDNDMWTLFILCFIHVIIRWHTNFPIRHVARYYRLIIVSRKCHGV